MSDIRNSLWVEKYRPKTMHEYVGNLELVDKVKHWIDTDGIPNLMFISEKSGTGKTSISKIIANSLDADVLYINASAENGIDTVRDKITNFASNVGFSKWKILILDEFSYFALGAQSALNSIIESTSAHTRFIFTGNYIQRILPSIKSRCTVFHVQTPSKPLVAKNIVRVLESEKVVYTASDVAKIVNLHYPDQRAILMECQKCSVTGTLVPDSVDVMVSEYLPKILLALTEGSDTKKTFITIRQTIADSGVKNFDDLFRYMYDNIESYAGSGKQAQCILHIADAQYKSVSCIDPEIQVAAMFINILKDLK